MNLSKCVSMLLTTNTIHDFQCSSLYLMRRTIAQDDIGNVPDKFVR